MLTKHSLPFKLPFYTQSSAGYLENGFATLDEAKEWEDRCCGIVSLKMIAEGIMPNAIPSVKELIAMGVAAGAYIPGKGWIHYKLVELGRTLGLEGAAHRGASLNELADSIKVGHPCIISVSPSFLGGQADENGKPMGKGGHLVVALGFTEEDDKLISLTVHHPSVHPERNHAFWEVPMEAVEASFGGNYMEFWK
ncbi:MAG: C39 family peptidase [Oscillospiraceae bacterium]|nr:C39 family peptidase [Oscillospiraceae bacterium]